MKSSNQRVRLTKTMLKNALLNLMETNKIEDITVKQIATYAEINRSTFYVHYENQYDLLNDIKSDLIDQTNHYLANVSSELSTIDSISSFLQYIKDNDRIIRILLCKNDSLEFHKEFVQSFVKMISTKVFFNTDPKVSRYIYQFIIMGGLNIIITWVDSNFDLSISQISKLIFKLSESAAIGFQT